ncbi:DNA topoisomerase I [Schizosaccharomyces japonicus yFS275]|uniref:DNA topoisomerase I n=1 Tax=Schizosaccharomyces japonicus (strain yFS275 / FY16936) TaxID=402676 RepID=B6JVY3_SCHJY|nr:DNA topoisomerase I [Schizosaccharomyces japonicus yFS275]EEB05534.2 DNA topoisomerase I [Schizosaccharomyces japonicus yFS275]
MSSSDSDSEPLISRRSSSRKRRKDKAVAESSSSDDDVPVKTKLERSDTKRSFSDAVSDDSDVPLKQTKRNRRSQSKALAIKDENSEEDEADGGHSGTSSPAFSDSGSDYEDEPIKQRVAKKARTQKTVASRATKKTTKSTKSTKSTAKTNGKSATKTTSRTRSRRTKMDEEIARSSASTPVKMEVDEDMKDSALSSKHSIAKSEVASPKMSGSIRSSPKTEEENGDFKWWETDLPDGKKWNTLEHNGVMFPPEYEPLPSHVKMLYNGKPIDLPPAAEEVAGFFGALLESDHAQNPTFQKNFFRDFQAVCKEAGMKSADIPKEFNSCDFRPMFEYFESLKEAKKNMSKEEKKELKKKKEEEEEKFKWCLLDGRKEKVGNFRIEPPGLFRGRGSHPKTGTLKRRVYPEQITINIGKGAKVPEPLPGHKWAEVRHDDQVTWLAMWHENVNGNVKYVFLAAGSSLKGQSDLKKYEKISELMIERQRGTAMYLIDVFALRAGNEKGEDEADTVGCCSLRYEHVTLKPPRTVIFDFLGKDSIRYYNEVEVDPQVFKNLKIFKRAPKKEGDLLFDRLTTGILNKYLNSLMEGLSAKVFRTYNASYTMARELEKLPPNLSLADKILFYNRANRTVAILCNHQRSVTKNHDIQMGRLEERLRGLKYQRLRLCRMLLNNDETLAKKRPELLKVDEELTPEWIKKHHEDLYELEKVKISKKFARENEKLVSEDPSSVMPDSELEERLKAADELKAKLDEELRTGAVEAGRSSNEQLEKRLIKMDERIKVMSNSIIDKDENKTTALGTSKINYIDPRLTFSLCKRENIPIEKLFSKTIRDKFNWAADTPADWNW